jgi:hypothetical protein
LNAWDITGGDPTFSGAISRLDHAEASRRCGSPNPLLFEPLAGRFLVAFDRSPDADALVQLGTVGRVRWLYRELGIAEVEATDADALGALPAIALVTPAWSAIGTTRGVAVGLNALSIFASRQAGDPNAFYRHPPGIGYPVISYRNDRQELDLDPTIEFVTPPALLPVVNMSLGTVSVGFPTAANDIVNLATAAASSRVLVVVAAGNCGERDGDSMSAWARPQWVLSVGAVDDEDGTKIASYSSRGDPGPDLVAVGRSELDPRKRGTSFAAPRVTFLARLVVAAFCELGREVMVAQGHAPMGVPSIGYGIVDDFGDEIWWERTSSTAFQALPLVGVRAPDVAKLVGNTAEALTVRNTPAVVREVLISSARPVPGASVEEAGAGFVNLDIVIERLAAITGEEVWRWFGTGPTPAGARLGDLRLFDAAGLRDLASVLNITGPIVKFDYRTGHWASLPQVDDQIREENPQGLPVDLTEYRLG